MIAAAVQCVSEPSDCPRALMREGKISDRKTQMTDPSPKACEAMNRVPSPDTVISTVPDAAFHITDAHTGPDGLPHFYIATALDRNRVLCLAVNARLFNAFLEEFRLGRTGEVFLINAEGILQSRSVLHGALLNRVDGLTGQSPDKVYARTWGGTRLWSAVLPTAHSGWRIVVQWDEREMTQSADARLIPLAGGGLAVFLVLVCSFGLTIAKIEKSRRKSAERQRQSEEQRMLVRKLDSIGQLGTGIAHEINNPLAIIGEEAGWMQDVLKRESIRDTPDAGDLRNALRQITLQTARCREVTHVEFVDIAGLVKGASKGEGLGNQFLAHIREVGILAHVVRCFDNDDIVHVANKIDPADDIETINMELAFADLDTVEKRIEKANRAARVMGKNEQKKAAVILSALDKIKPLLENSKSGFILSKANNITLFRSVVEPCRTRYG